MQMLLVSKGLWSAVSGEEAVSSTKEQPAHAAIVLNLADSQLLHVIGAETARAAWGKLASFHYTQGMANCLWLKEKFASFKYTSSSISAHVTELEELVLQMKSASCGPSEEDTCEVMLSSLPPIYESLVQAFRMAVTSFKFSDLVSKLIAEEVRQGDSARVEDATALCTSKKGNKPWHKKQQGRRSKKAVGACFNRGKTVHHARDCRSSRGSRDIGHDQSNGTFTASEVSSSDKWVMDSGASTHMCKDRGAFENYHEVQHPRSISSAKSSAKLRVLGTSLVKLRVWTGRIWIDVRLEDTLHVQDLTKNLLSLTAAASRKMKVEITQNECVIKRNGVPVATGTKKGFLLYFNVNTGEECHVAEEDIELWHRRLGHAFYGVVNAMVKDGRLSGVKMKSDAECDVCATAKQARKTFKASNEDYEGKESERSDDLV